MRKNFTRYTENESFEPKGYHQEFIQQRRAATEEYLGRWYVTKAIVVIAACAITLIFVHFAALTDRSMQGAPYLLLVAVMLGNEWLA